MERIKLVALALFILMLSVSIAADSIGSIEEVQGGEANVSENVQYHLTGGITYGLDMEEIGIMLGAVRPIAPEMRLGGDIVYWLVDSDITQLEVNFNFNYMFQEEGERNIYGLASLGYHHVSVGDHSDSDISLAVGGGVEFQMDGFRIFIEPRLFLGGFEQLSLAFGVRYPL